MALFRVRLGAVWTKEGGEVEVFEGADELAAMDAGDDAGAEEDDGLVMLPAHLM